MANMETVDWSVCYGAIARKIRGYRDDRKKLVRIVSEVFSDKSIEQKVHDIDPFTVFLKFNGTTNKHKRKDYITNLADRLGIDKEACSLSDEQLELIPGLGRHKSYYGDKFKGYTVDDIKRNIDVLWDLFVYVLDVDDNKAMLSDERFTGLFEKAINIENNGVSKITMGLAWVAPKVCLSLDGKVKDYIYGKDGKHGAIPDDVINLLDKIIIKNDIKDKNKFTGEKYVEYVNIIRTYLEGEDNHSGCTNFMDVSVAAWLENGDSKGDEDSGAGEEDSGKDDNTKEAGEPDQGNARDGSEQNNRQEGTEGNAGDAAAGDSAAKKHIRPDDDEGRCPDGENILYYGVPGSGKSYKIDEEIDSLEGITEKDEDEKKKRRKELDIDSRTERVVFHPDYTYSDFIGQIMPRVIRNDATSDGRLVYEFVPGPFTSILKKALYDPEKKYYLRIEEINRGNAPAIFGDVFQLLDRKDGAGGGSYSITNRDIQEFIDTKTDENGRKIVEEKKYIVMIPSNLWIYATMNTSDQNVFTLDTAFQRRWDMRLVKNDFNKTDKTNWTKSKIGGSEITWGAFGNVVNSMVLDVNKGMLSSEDKRLGVYFIRSKDELKRERFPEKVLKYLWDDAFRNNRYAIFKEKLSSLEDVITVYENTSKGDDPLKAVLRVDVYDKMLKRSEENSGETSQSGTPVYQSTADDDANADGDSADRIDDDGE